MQARRPLRSLALASGAALATALLLAGCGGKGAPAGAGTAATPLATEVVKPVAVPAERGLDGTVEAVEQATISAQTAGRVAELLYDVNDRVPAGAVIVRLRGTEQRAGLEQAQAARQEATARESEALARFARISDMYERKVVAKAQYEQALAERDAAVARVAAANAAVATAREGFAYTEVRAPYAGILTARLVRVGEAVGPGTPLVRGYSLDRLRVVCDLPQDLAARMREVPKAAIYVDGRRIEATAVTVFAETDAATSTVRARLELPAETTGIYPGMFVKAGFVTGEELRLLVPGTAIVRRSEVTAVYVVDKDGRPALRQVRTGTRFGDRVEILAGLAAGEHVALDPLAAIQSLAPAAATASPGGNG